MSDNSDGTAVLYVVVGIRADGSYILAPAQGVPVGDGTVKLAVG